MAIKYLAGNRLVSNDAGDSKPTLTAAVAGTTYLDVAQDLWRWDGDSWELVVGNLLTENFENKTFVDYCLVSEVSTPSGTVGSSKGAIYAKDDGKAYWKFENESEVDLTIGAGATSLGGLSDVTISSDAAGHILVRNTADSAYINVALSGATGTTATMSGAGALGVTVLTALTDLDMTNANHTIFNNMAGKTLTIGASDTAIVTGAGLVVTGDLTVSGTTTTVDTANLRIEDPLLVLNYNHANSASANDVGFIVERGSSTNVFFGWDESEDEFAAFSTNEAGGTAGNVAIISSTYHDLQIAGLTATTGAFSGVLSATSKILVDVADATNVTAGVDGHLIHVDAVTLNDNTTAEDGTAAAFNLINIEAPTITVANDGVTVTRAATVLIGGAPADGDSELTITNAYALYVAGGASHFVGAVSSASTITAAGTLVATNAATVGTTLAVSGATTLNGHVTLGNQTADDITFTGYIASHLYPKTDGAYDIGEANGTREWRNLYITGTAYIDTLSTGVTIPDPSMSGTIQLIEDAVIVFEGATNNANETTLTVVDPTGDRVVSLPDATDTLVGKATTDILTNKTLTTPVINTPAITGGTAIELTVLSVRDNGGTYDLEFQSATTGMGADRVLIFDVNNVNRTVSLAGNVTTAHNFITAGAYALTLTTTTTTNVTLPSTGTLATLAGAEILSSKTLTAPKFVDAGFIADAYGAEMLVFNTKASSGVENHFSMTNARDSGTDTGPVFAAVGDDTNVALRLQGKGTGASAVIEGGVTGACIEFTTKYTGGDAANVEYARMYLKNVDANNNALAVRIQKAGTVREVEITSPKAICGECGSKDGALDPTYDFSRSMMIVELWCGHSYEVPMNGWNMVS